MIIFLRPLKLLKCICDHTGSGKDRGPSGSGRWSPSPNGPLKVEMPFRPRHAVTGGAGAGGDVEEMSFLLDIFSAKQIHRHEIIPIFQIYRPSLSFVENDLQFCASQYLSFELLCGSKTIQGIFPLAATVLQDR